MYYTKKSTAHIFILNDIVCVKFKVSIKFLNLKYLNILSINDFQCYANIISSNHLTNDCTIQHIN